MKNPIEKKKNERLTQCKSNIHHIIQSNRFSSENIDKLQEYLQKIARQQLIFQLDGIEAASKEVPSLPPSPPPIEQEETLDSLLQADRACMNTVKNLSDLNEETISIINNQLAIEAIEAGDTKFGIETLENSAKDGRNAAALYNLGICYERGIGVEQDRAKACDYYRRASLLGHINAQFNLTVLSNDIDTREIEEEVETKPSIAAKFRLSFAKEYQEQYSSSSWSDYHFNLTKTLACLS